MAELQVVALQPGYRKSTASRVATGDIFTLDDVALSKLKKDKDGKPILPKWLKAAPDAAAARAESVAVKAAEDKRGLAAAMAASGGAAAKQKAKDIADQLGG